MRKIELAILGGGSAGLAAAIEASNQGIKEIVIFERDIELGGILNQCIHNGFGLHLFKEELAGPTYAERFVKLANDKKIEVKLQTMVTHLSSTHQIDYVNSQEGYQSIQAKAIVLAMGCRERTRGAISIPGSRPSGIWSAGTAQRYLNIDGYLVGKKIFILGSGDIGLIMARRMTIEGAKVLGVAEIMPYSNGLSRNIAQCLNDFDIPLYLSHTISKISGKSRVEKIVISQVDESLKIIAGTEKEFEVDTVLFSVGLIPENALSEEAHIEIDSKTKGAIVNESYMSSVPGIFACGNVLHVHDLVDYVSMEGIKAGAYAAQYIKEPRLETEKFNVMPGKGVSYVIPQIIHPKKLEDEIEFMFRVKHVVAQAKIIVYKGDEVIKTIQRKHLAPAEMEKIKVSKLDLSKNNLDVKIEIMEVE